MKIQMALLLACTFVKTMTYCQEQDKNKVVDPLIIKQIETVRTDTSNKEKIYENQSAYYDAIDLYYLMRGYSVYPELLTVGDVENPADSPFPPKKNPGGIPGANANDEDHDGRAPHEVEIPVKKDSLYGKFRIRECITHKIIVNEYIGILETVLNKYPIDSTLRTKLISQILLNYPNTQLNTKFNFSALTPFPIPMKFSAAGGLSPTTKILQGMADWAIEATNREIQEAVFITLKKALEHVPELAVLFPKSLETLTGIEITNYNNSLTAFKRSFSEDLSNIAGNFVNLSELPKYSDVLMKHPNMVLLFLGADVFQKLKSKNQSPASIITSVGNSNYLAATGPSTVKSLLQLAAIMSNAFRDVRSEDGLDMSEKTEWLDEFKLQALVENPYLYRIFINLLQSKMSGIVIGKTSVGPLLDKTDLLAGAVFNIARRSIELERWIAYAKAMDSTMSFQDRALEYVSLAGKLIDFSTLAFDLMPTTIEVLNFRTLVDRVKTEALPLLQASADVAVRVRAKDYSGAVYATDTLISILRRAFDPTAAIDSMTRLHSNLLHYGLFVANVAEAKTAGDVKDAINSIALPKGSSRIKKESDFSWGINAYAGFTSAWNKQYPDVNLRSRENTVFVPFGINFNKGHFLSGSLSLHAGIIDLGAIFTYRVNNSTNDLESDIRLEQVFSPSLSVIYGLPIIRQYNIPLSLGAGWQWGPRLRRIDDQDGNSVLPFLTRRFQVFAVVYLPVINFHVSRSDRQRRRN